MGQVNSKLFSVARIAAIFFQHVDRYMDLVGPAEVAEVAALGEADE